MEVDYGYTYRKKMQQLQYGVNSLSKFTVAHRFLFSEEPQDVLFLPCLLLDPRLAIFPPSDFLRIGFVAPADHSCVINAFVV